MKKCLVLRFTQHSALHTWQLTFILVDFFLRKVIDHFPKWHFLNIHFGFLKRGNKKCVLTAQVYHRCAMYWTFFWHWNRNSWSFLETKLVWESITILIPLLDVIRKNTQFLDFHRSDYPLFIQLSTQNIKILMRAKMNCRHIWLV